MNTDARTHKHTHTHMTAGALGLHNSVCRGTPSKIIHIPAGGATPSLSSSRSRSYPNRAGLPPCLVFCCVLALSSVVSLPCLLLCPSLVLPRACSLKVRVVVGILSGLRLSRRACHAPSRRATGMCLLPLALLGVGLRPIEIVMRRGLEATPRICLKPQASCR